MPQHNLTALRQFYKGMNSDVDLAKLATDQYFAARNLEGGHGVLFGARRPHKGTIQIPVTYEPGGTYFTMGGIEDKPNERLIYFVTDFSGNSNYYIMMLEGNSVTRLLWDETLLFNRNRLIHSGAVVDGCLYWTDGTDRFGAPEGQEPKRLCIERHRPGKQIRYELLFNNACFEDGVEYAFELYDLDGNLLTPVPTVFFTVPPGGSADRSGTITGIFNGLGSNLFSVIPPALNTIDNPATYLEFFYLIADRRVNIIVTHPTVNPQVKLNELNFYPLPSTTPNFDLMLNLAVPCPLEEPVPRYVVDNTNIETNIRGKAFQFRMRYVFVDGQKSAWGPASFVATNFEPEGPGPVPPSTNDRVVNSRLYNKIIVNFQDEYLDAPGWGTYIRSVEFCVRTDFNKPWLFIDSFDLRDFYIDELEFDFRNLRTSLPVPSDEAAGEGVQALKNYDFVPRIALGMEVVYDRQGNSILTTSGLLVDYDIPIQTSEIEYRPVTIPALDYAYDDQTTRNKGLKSGGSYLIGHRYEDWAGRLSPVVPQGELHIPFAQDPVGSDPPTIKTHSVSYQPLTPPPGWAVGWRVCISKNRKQSAYWQSQTGVVKRYGLNQDTTELIEDQVNGKYIGFHYHLALLDPNSTNPIVSNIFEKEQSDLHFFLPEYGDHLVVRGWRGLPFTGPVNPDANDIELYDYEVAGYSFVTLDEGQGVMAKHLVVLIEALGAPSFYGIQDDIGQPFRYNTEVYRPVADESSEIYFEYGPRVKIVGSHGAVSLDGYGDTYVRHRDGVDPPNSITDTTGEPHYMYETPTLYVPESPLNPNPDHGRPIAVDPLYQARYLKSTIRHSDILIPQSSINGFSSFRGASIFRINEEVGPVRRLVMNQNVLLAIGQTKTQPIYVAKDRLMSLSGSSLVGRSTDVFNIAEETKYDYGTTWPASVFYENGNTYGLDTRQGVAWRYDAGSGQFPISSFGQVNHFIDAAEVLQQGRINDTVVTAMERRTQAVVFAYGFSSNVFKEEPGNPHWLSYLDFTPEWLSSVGLDLIAFKDAQPWRFSEDAPRATIFGEQKVPSITLSINDLDGVIKLWDGIEIQASTLWYVPFITIPQNLGYDNEQISSIPANKFEFVEGTARADFLRDHNDPAFSNIGDSTLRRVTSLLQGRHLRGRYMLIQIELVELGTDSFLRNVMVSFQASQQTFIQSV